MQTGRLFSILYLLMEHGNMTAKQLAERFEVSPRTIYRDIDLLSGAGIPIYASKGKGGGIQLLSHFVLDRSLLSSEEQDEILFALQSLRAANMQGTQVLSRLHGLFSEACNGLDRCRLFQLEWRLSGAGDFRYSQNRDLGTICVGIFLFQYFGGDRPALCGTDEIALPQQQLVFAGLLPHQTGLPHL